MGERLPAELAESLAASSETLARKRALAMYGDEAKGLGPDEIFGKEDGVGALRMAKDAYGACRRQVSDLRRKTKPYRKGLVGRRNDAVA